MKIYDRKKMISGVLFFLLGVFLLVAGFLKGFDAEQVFLSILMPLIGASEIYLSANKEAVRQEKFEKEEERNHLVRLTSESKAFHVTQKIVFVLMVFLLILGGKSGNQSFIAMGVAFAVSYSVSMFSELFTRIYYERHM